MLRSTRTTRVSMLSSIYNYFRGITPLPTTPQRTFTTNPSLPENAFHPRLSPIISQLDSLAPRFALHSDDIDILSSPDEFYNLLTQKISAAKSRIYLSSLYIGKKQTDLIDCIDQAMSKNDELKVHILTDALRGTREAPNPCSASLLVGLVEKYGKHRIDVRMYHTPHLSGITKSITPKRINEGWGLQHMKLYGFDEEIILSGANLSQDYFTNRQDRYYVFKNKSITDYYFRIHTAISSLSYQVTESKLKQGFKLTWPTSNKSCEPHMNLHRFISDSGHLLEPILKQHPITDDGSDFDTIVYPVSQFTPLFPQNQDSSTEKPSILRILTYLDSPSIKWWFTAGYFNMLPEIQHRLLNGKAEGSVITASPKANSFYKSPGVSYYLPQAYLLFTKQFLQQVKQKHSAITVYEWENGEVNTPEGWSYHAKGLWVSIPNETKPSITIIGSSNYTKRAYSSDLESNAVIITKSDKLKSKMKQEIDNLMKHTQELSLDDFQPRAVPGTNEQEPPRYVIDEDRKITYGVHLAVKLLGGKL
ncbi:phosphatidylglycerolphosphate synthase [Spathaspora passalidarum NRRL Y-27907]|uniref:CDP-diacylglycerol--glycerol-3-phosphate 3-phosphatidyltransferase n=1 Tax=Spathaspora passalidarum (strain NRRL Y-27907 / 11-Y1) TaxID=619300 RepID=G3AVM9_SPAPN|nr:phosphatidylglycerolphosphate synthase [Spathaspora passalidarum NRRL Y-27907]EGW30194.1 phosphatidylglycerolphosphate synthase [Spathaspora passalidarum NRRL Y-27907]